MQFCQVDKFVTVIDRSPLNVTVKFVTSLCITDRHRTIIMSYYKTQIEILISACLFLVYADFLSLESAFGEYGSEMNALLFDKLI